MTEKPLISIIIPVYNGSDFLAQAINSALNQVYNNIEIIVINDGSTDNLKTEQTALSFGKKIKYFSKKNGGAATALNFGIEHMSGEYFSWLSHDDMYTPQKIALQVEALPKDGSLAVISGNYEHISENGKHLSYHTLPPSYIQNIRTCLAIGGETGINGCTLLIPRKAFELYGIFDPALKYTQDYDMWFRLASHLNFIHVDDFMVLSRQHLGQDSRKQSAESSVAADMLHSSLIPMLSFDEIKKYVNDNSGNLIQMFILYMNSSYFCSAGEILDIIFKFYPQKLKKQKYRQLFYDYAALAGKEYYKDEWESSLPISRQPAEKNRKKCTIKKYLLKAAFINIKKFGIRDTLFKIINRIKG